MQPLPFLYIKLEYPSWIVILTSLTAVVHVVVKTRVVLGVVLGVMNDTVPNMFNFAVAGQN